MEELEVSSHVEEPCRGAAEGDAGQTGRHDGGPQ
jgi:hypothetical protein